MHTNIYLIRHGEVVFEKDTQGRKLIYFSTAHLAPLGITQLHKPGLELKKEHVFLETLVVSPYIRAQESAVILQKELGVTFFYTEEDLKDVYPNSWEGFPFDEYLLHGGDGYSHPRTAYQESLEHIVKRGRHVIEKIIQKNEGHTIGIVSHGDLLSALHWALKFKDIIPMGYKEMIKSFYLQKGQAYHIVVNSSFQIVGNGRFITVAEVHQSTEDFRNSTPQKTTV